MNFKGYGEISFENYMGEQMAKEFQECIDFDVLCDTLVPFGWTVVYVVYGPDRKWIDVLAWFESNCVGDYKEHNGKWLIKNSKDAILFKLKWA